jgi:hypothetical protein
MVILSVVAAAPCTGQPAATVRSRGSPNGAHAKKKRGGDRTSCGDHRTAGGDDRGVDRLHPASAARATGLRRDVAAADGERGRAARFEVANDNTYTAHDVPVSIACGTKIYSGSPPGCAGHRAAVDFSGKWRLSEDDSEDFRLYFAALLVRKRYRDGNELGSYTRTLDAPRPDYVFTRDSSKSR